MIDRKQLFIAGRWVAASTGAAIEVRDANNGQVMGSVPAGEAGDVDRAVHAASSALEAWSQTPVSARCDYLEKISAELKSRADELTQTIAREVGMPVRIASRVQVGLPISNFSNFAGMARQYRFEERIGNSLVRRVPVGVVGAITPWNVPLHQIALKTAPALAAGCTVVLKPSEIAPFNAFILAEAIERAELPPGVFNLVSGYGATAGEALVRDPRVDMISFTGSTRAGRRISELAAQSVKRVALELGGKSPSVILDDADLESAVKATVNACFLNSGQACNALSRMLVPADRHDEAARIAVDVAKSFSVGEATSPATKLGPLASRAQLDRVHEYIRQGLAEGARLLCGGTDAPPGSPAGGYFAQPTVFGNVRNSMRIAQEEIFGPVLSIIPYRTEDEAVQLANDTVYGLAAAVWSGDEARARGVAARIRAGQIDINGGAFNMNAPFGGFKQSGHGREAGTYGLEEFLASQSFQLKE